MKKVIIDTIFVILECALKVMYNLCVNIIVIFVYFLFDINDKIDTYIYILYKNQIAY